MATRADRAAPLRRAPHRIAKNPKPPIRFLHPNSRRSRRLGEVAKPRPNYVLSDDSDRDDEEEDGRDDSDVSSDSDVDDATRRSSFAASAGSGPVRRSKRKRAPTDRPATPPPAPKRRTPRTPATPRSALAIRNLNGGAGTPSRSRKLHSPRNADSVASLVPQDPNAVIPPWQTLPYLILVQVMLHASSPLSEIASVRWLLAAGRTCRAFAEPAITALYRSPPLLKTPMVHNLIALLARPADELMFNYHQKIENITIDVGVLDSHVYQGRRIDFKALVSRCPRVTDIDICHYKDGSPYRHLDENLKWTYPAGLFEGLSGGASTSGAGLDEDTTPIRLKDWRWSSRMMGDMKLSDLKKLHLSPNFADLQRVTFVNFQRPALRAKDAEDAEVIAEDKQHAESFGEMLAALPKLRHLVLESCTAANEYLLPLLPKTIEHLELINCWDVNADHFTEYLLSHGSALRSLTLDHNQSLSLAFLPVLRDACPKLRALRMNLTYYSQHEFYNDSDPMYEKLLEPHQIPTWPSSIQVIELEHLRHWEVKAAVNLFQSLVDNASDFPALRRLVIKSMLDIPWRERSKIRDKWVSDFTQVFRRRVEDPKPCHTLRPAEEPAPAAAVTKKRRAKSTTPSRRSSRIIASNPSSRAGSIARGLRQAGDGRVSYREPDTDEESDADFDSEARQEEKQKEDEDAMESVERDAPSPTSAVGFVQGLCDVVDVRFDNQKPMETQYTIEDFIDSDDANDDDEWNGDDGGDAGYAW